MANEEEKEKKKKKEHVEIKPDYELKEEFDFENAREGDWRNRICCWADCGVRKWQTKKKPKQKELPKNPLR